MAEWMDMFMPTPFNITLIAAIYIVHRSFYSVDSTGFVVSAAIALSSNFMMVKYMHAPELAAMSNKSPAIC